MMIENQHSLASGYDYYFDLDLTDGNAYTLVVPTKGGRKGEGKVLPYHHKVEAGSVPPNLSRCVLMIGEPASSSSGAYEVPECTQAPAGAISAYNEHFGF